MFGSNPPPLITIGTPLILKARAPLGSIAFDPTRDEVTVLMPKVSVVALYWVAPCATVTPRVYSGCAPSWYGHQTCGLAMVREGKLAGVNDTVWVVLAGTVTAWLTVIGVPVPGGVMVAVTVADWAVAVLLVTSVLTVSAALDKSAASAWLTCELLTARAPSTWSWTGNWMPVLLSGGIWVQSTLSRVNMEVGSFGLTSIASEFVPATSRFVRLTVNRV